MITLHGFIIIIILGFPLNIHAIKENISPRPFLKLVEEADEIVLAKSVHEEGLDELTNIRVLSFEVIEFIKSEEGHPPFTLNIGNRSAFYFLTKHGEPVLLFLKDNKDGTFGLLNAFDQTRTRGGLTSLVSVVKRYHDINIRDMKPFLIDNLKRYGDGTFIRQSAAIDLLDLMKTWAIELTGEEPLLIKEVLMNSKDPKVVFPLCHVLKKIDDPALDDVCYYAITEMDPGKAGIFEICYIIYNRPSLMAMLIENAKQENDTNKLHNIINYLTQILTTETMGYLKSILAANESAHELIMFYAKHRLGVEGLKELENYAATGGE